MSLMKPREELAALAQLVYNFNKDGVNAIISNDRANCININDTITAIDDTVATSANKLRELEMRISVLESRIKTQEAFNVLKNRIEAQEILKDKYIVVLGE